MKTLLPAKQYRVFYRPEGQKRTIPLVTLGNNTMYELQLFDTDAGQYVPVMTGEEPHKLLKQGRQHDGPRRVVNTARETDPDPRRMYRKPLPLKPRKLPRLWRRYKPETMIEPATVDQLLDRATCWYLTRVESGQRDIPVYLWASEFGYKLFDRLSQRDPGGVYRFVWLDGNEPGSAFGPDCIEYAAPDRDMLDQAA